MRRLIIEMKRILSLQSLRFFGFIFVFCIHIKEFLPFEIPDLGARGVEFFFVLSGFTMAYNYCKKDIKCSLKECFKFSYIRAKKFYLLHIITFILAFLLIISNNKLNIILIGKAVLNIILVQSWIPSIKFSFNGVSWFLSALLFCYFMTPAIFYVIKKIKKNFILMVLLIFFKILYETIYSKYINIDIGYFFHVFPLYQLTQYMLGCIIGTIFVDEEEEIKKQSSKFTSILQIIAIIFYLMAVIIGNQALWQRYMYVFFVMFLIYILAIETGIVYKILSNRILLHLGNISLELFMFHQIILRYIIRIFGKTNGMFVVSFTIIVTIIVSELMHYIITPALKGFTRRN